MRAGDLLAYALAAIAAGALVATAAAGLEEPKKPLIAVLEFRTKLDPQAKADADPTYFSDVVRSQALDELPGARIMTRENMTVLLKAAGKDLSQCEGECDVETGQNLGADDVINGELLKVGTNFKLDLKLHATADGRLLAGAQASGKTVDELDAALPAAVTKLLAPLRAQPAPAKVAAVNPPAATPIAEKPRLSSPYHYIRVVDDRVVYRQTLFQAGARDVSRDALPMLREVARALRGPPERKASIVCRSDDASGAARRNALQRAWALRHALVELGVPPRTLIPRVALAAEQTQLVRQVAHPYLCEIVLR